MAKESISATVEQTTANSVREIAKKEKRSFSQMVDLLLQNAISVFKDTERKSKK